MHVKYLKQNQTYFSKGGFVSVPVVIAARSLKIPTIIHESDLTPGLANKISLKFAKKIYTTFEDTLTYLPKDKADFVGATVREDLKQGIKKEDINSLILIKIKSVISHGRKFR